jgi:nucleosome assembly protein 1-like 1
MDKDFDIARLIKDEIIPYSLEYYLGTKINEGYEDVESFDEADFEQIDDEVEDEEQAKQKTTIVAGTTANMMQNSSPVK